MLRATAFVITSLVCAHLCHGQGTLSVEESNFKIFTNRKTSQSCRIWTDCPDTRRMSCEYHKCVCKTPFYDTKILDNGEIRCVDKGPNIGLFVGLAVGGFVLFLIFGCLSWCYWRKRRPLLVLPGAVITTAPERARCNDFSNTYPPPLGLGSNASPTFGAGTYPPPLGYGSYAPPPFGAGTYPPPPPPYQPYSITVGAAPIC